MLVSPERLRLANDHAAVAVRPAGLADLAATIGTLGLSRPRPVVAVVGGAGLMDDDDLTDLFAHLIATAISEMGAVAVDGGTDAGVMRMLGRSRESESRAFPLVGVAALGTVIFPGNPGGAEAVPLEPHHSHFVLVPGADFGDEAPYLARTATLLAGGAPSATILVNGGEIAFEDCLLSVAEHRPVLVLGGTGRTADRIAAAAADPASCRDERAVDLALSPWVRVTDVHNRRAAVTNLLKLLRSGPEI
ncbi:hypothetical protein BJ973_001648 [Actinoplanes tereljensis]|uniref:LSDAT prokaryote domain-containing protein n=1 Tax=Paractinoplanes tereljensis TaxID=571912 RepID=A0A919TRM4_9ACTN|nr:hypothetical protein [Actinoplanes tereljensis]GIF20448.1 hypothetical protein Ate02nite_31780 [Actinoplanes tereljensis]